VRRRQTDCCISRPVSHPSHDHLPGQPLHLGPVPSKWYSERSRRVIICSQRGNKVDVLTLCAVLPQNLVEDAVKVLVTQFIPLKPSDLEGWKEDPESWVNTEEVENDQWEYDLRVRRSPILSSLYSSSRSRARSEYSLCYPTNILNSLPPSSQTRSARSPVCLRCRVCCAVLKPIVPVARANDLPSLMQKEALYCAVGRCVSQLQRHIQFDHWLETVLLPESQETDPKLVYERPSYQVC
jgi:hypothetical protein